MSMTILGLATAEPARSTGAGCRQIARTFLSAGREARLLPALFQRTQVRSRGSVLLEAGNGCGPHDFSTRRPPARRIAHGKFGGQMPGAMRHADPGSSATACLPSGGLATGPRT